MSRKRRQFVILGPAIPSGGTQPLGRIRDLREMLGGRNTSGDTAPVSGPIERLHGPGMVIDLPLSADPVPQMIVSLHDESYAWPVLEALCRAGKWTLMDVESGRTLGFG